MNLVKNYEEIKTILKQPISIIIAKTKQCSVCVPVTKRLDEIMTNYPSIPYYHVYLEDVQEFQGQHLIFTVPTIVIYSGEKELLRESRFINFSNIERLISLYSS